MMILVIYDDHCILDSTTGQLVSHLLDLAYWCAPSAVQGLSFRDVVAATRNDQKWMKMGSWKDDLSSPNTGCHPCHPLPTSEED